MHRHRRERPLAHRLSRRGFTVVEVIAAIGILAVGVLGLAASSALVSRLLGEGDQRTTAAMVAQRRFERMRATRCASLASGGASAGGITEQWTVVRTVGAPALNLREVTDSVTYGVRAGTRGHSFRSIIECLP
jgi:prepilin-type N-terminal cleavage/methylation domain-containing protein